MSHERFFHTMTTTAVIHVLYLNGFRSSPYVGVLTMWDAPKELFEFRPEFLDQFKDMDVSQQTPAAAELLIAAKGDEVLDWHKMQARYPQATMLLQEGSNHGLANFADYLRIFRLVAMPASLLFTKKRAACASISILKGLFYYYFFNPYT